MAAAVRALLRRRAAAPPSLALLQPLFPGRGSESRSPLLPATAAAAAIGLPVVRRPQLSPAPAVAPLLRYYSSEPKPSKGWAPPPQRQPPTSGKEMPRLPRLELEPEDVEFLTGGLLEDLEKHNRNLVEALKICKKANALLNEGWDKKTVAMFENGLVKAFEALANREKALDDLSGALSSSNALSKDTLQRLQMFHKELIDDTKFTREELIEVLAFVVALKIRNNDDEVAVLISLLGRKKPNNKLSKFEGTAVALGMCFALAMMINVIFLHIIRI